jgi:hypothetical protein
VVTFTKSLEKRESLVKKTLKTPQTQTKDEKAEALWEIFERTGSIGAYLLYCEQIEDVVPKPADAGKNKDS